MPQNKNLSSVPDDNFEHKNKNEDVYLVLARKYRPKNFQELIGQEAMVDTFKNAFKTGRIAQAFIFTGVRGVGKTTTARILARALNYETDKIQKPDILLEEYGRHCESIIEGSHPDVVEMDAASHTGIDDVREIIENSRYKPLYARYKIYIIDEVHMLSNQAFNGLLKTLEEPPPHVKFIFATTEIHKVPVTVLSRCQRFDLRRIPQEKLIQHLENIALKENINYEEHALALLTKASEGSVRDALSLFDQAAAYSNYNVTSAHVQNMLGLVDRSYIFAIFEAIMRGDSQKALTIYNEQYENGAAPIAILNGLAELTHKISKLRFLENYCDPSFTLEQQNLAKEYAQKLSTQILAIHWQMLLKAISDVNQSSFMHQACEMALIRLSHSSQLPPLTQILQQDTQKKTLKLAPDEQNISEHKETNSSAPITIVPKTDENSINNLEELLFFIEQKGNETLLKLILTEQIYVVNCKMGYIKYSVHDNALADVHELLKKYLQELTGETWVLEEADKNIGLPLKKVQEKKAQERYNKLIEKAKKNSHIKEILQQLPNSKISIKFKDYS